MSRSETLSDDIRIYVNGLWLERGLTKNTIESYQIDLLKFECWLSAKGVKRLIDAKGLTYRIILDISWKVADLLDLVRVSYLA